jgi:cytochrome P450
MSSVDTKSARSSSELDDGGLRWPPPGPRMPGFAQMVFYGLHPYGFFGHAQRRWGPIFTVRLMQETWVVLAEPAAVAELFGRGPEAVDAGQANFPMRGIIGERNTFLFDGSEHLDRRRLIVGPLHGRGMAGNAEHVLDVLDRGVASWPTGRPFAALPTFRRVTFDLMTYLALGDPSAAGNRAISDVLWDMAGWSVAKHVSGVFAVFGPERYMRLAGYERRLAALDRAVFAEIGRRRIAGVDRHATDCMSVLLSKTTNDGVSLSDRDVRDEVVSLMLAGYQNSTGLLAWGVHELARDPIAQERLQAREPGFADRVITETLRLHPPHLTARRLREPMSLHGYDLPAGTFVLVTATTVHRRKDLYKDPMAFQPDRFEAGRKPAVGSWLPYGGGVRRCPGASLAHLEARLMLERIVDRFTLTAGRRRERLRRDGFVTVPGRGVRITVAARTDPASREGREAR